MKRRLIALLTTVSLLLTTVTTAVPTVSTQELEMRLVNTGDALEILKCIVKLIDPLPLDPYDFNGNGEIDTGDALEVLKSIVKLIDPPLMIRVNLSSNGCSDCGEVTCICLINTVCEDCGENPCECEEIAKCPYDGKSRFGGIIAPPAVNNHTNFINGNSVGLDDLNALEFNVLELINGTAIKPDDVHGIEVSTLSNDTENRYVKALSDGNEPSKFNVRIYPNDDGSSLVASIALLDVNGEYLGFTVYSTQDSEGTWSEFYSFVTTCTCGECEDFSDETEHFIYAEAEYNSASGVVSISWDSTMPESEFELLYIPFDEEDYVSLAVVENATNYEYQTDGTDFIKLYFIVRQAIQDVEEDDYFITSNACIVIWSPDEICWTEHTREWTVEADDELLSEVNSDNKFYQMSVEIVAAGIPELHLKAFESSYSHVMQNDMMLGVIPELDYPEHLAVESITVRFTIADEYIDIAQCLFPDHPEFVGIRRLNVFKWFDEVNMSLPIETHFDGDTLYAVVDEIGTFCVMDMEKWFAMLEEFAGEEELASTPTELSDVDDSVGVDFENIEPTVGIPMPSHTVAIANLLSPANTLAFITIQGISYSTSLTSLDLRSRGLTSADIALLPYMTNLQSLNLGGNRISDLMPLSGLMKLERLFLISNEISDLTPLRGLVNLQLLAVNNNEISEITALSGLFRLSDLTLSNNQISDITPLSRLTGLEHLWLSDNQIRNLNPLNALMSLRLLDLRSLGGLTNLQRLELGNNPITLTHISASQKVLTRCIINHDSTDTSPCFICGGAVCVCFTTTCNGCSKVRCICVSQKCTACGEFKAPCESNSASKPYEILLGTNWKPIVLKERPREDRTIHSDKDCTRDWEEIITGTEKGTVRWNNRTERATFPTVGEMREFGRNNVNMDGLNRFVRDKVSGSAEFNESKHRLEKALSTEVLPVHSNPKSNDTSDDGIPDCDATSLLKKFVYPIILIHGRNDNSNKCFGVATNVRTGDNNHYGDYKTKNRDLVYTNIATHEISSIHSGTIGHELTTKGFNGRNYKKNVSLFAFNYPNRDFAKANAKKLDGYIEGLKGAAKNGHDVLKIEVENIFARKSDIDKNEASFILTGHSNGGLVSRFYIENHEIVDKNGNKVEDKDGKNTTGNVNVKQLITINTPHFGSGIAWFSYVLGLSTSALAIAVPVFLGGIQGIPVSVATTALVDALVSEESFPMDVDLLPGSQLTSGGSFLADFFTPHSLSVGKALYVKRNQSPQLSGERGQTKYYAIGAYDAHEDIVNINVAHNNEDLSVLEPFVVSFTRSVTSKSAFIKSIASEINDTLKNEHNFNHLGIYFNENGGDNVVNLYSQFGVKFNNDKNNPVDKVDFEKTALVVNTRSRNDKGKYKSSNHFHGSQENLASEATRGLVWQFVNENYSVIGGVRS